MCYIYLDQNILDYISKGALELPQHFSARWVYSNEHFNEIERASDTRFLDVLRNLKAQKLEIKLDEKFQITGEMQIIEQSDPHDLYADWQAARAKTPFNDEHLLAIISRLFGANNSCMLDKVPEAIEREVTELLLSAGLLDKAQQKAIAETRTAMETMVCEHLAERPHLETLRAAVGTHRGRASNLIDNDNPLEALWALMNKAFPDISNAITPDQFFGFQSLQENENTQSSIYLGILACYMMLNMIGLRPDEKLSQVQRMKAIMSDASHVGYAAYCQVILSADRRLCDKAKAIYRYKNIGTQVWQLKRQNI